MAEKVKAIKNHDDDNVATVFGDVGEGVIVSVLDKKGSIAEYKANSAIPYGHKIALVPIAVGEQVTKYGEEIGIASAEINTGDYVHVHNIESIRGRGDWDKGGKE